MNRTDITDTHTPHQQADISPIVNALLPIIPADKIFLKQHCLYIVLSEDTVHTLQQYKVILEGSGWDGKGYRPTFYALAEVRAGLEAGRMLHSTIFIPRYLVYDSGRSVLPVPLAVRIAEERRQSAGAFTQGCEASRDFLDSARLMLNNRRPERAVFFLHQSVELLLRGFIIAVTGREVKTHVLSDLLRAAAWHAPQLPELFPADASPGKSLLAQLEKGYVCARYSAHFRTDVDCARRLYETAADMHRYLCGVYREVLQDYTGRLISEHCTCRSFTPGTDGDAAGLSGQYNAPASDLIKSFAG